MSSILPALDVTMRAKFLVPSFAAALLACATPVRAQLDNLLTGYSLTSWNEGDGHPLGSVYAMVQDPQGYLWLGTDAGLFRFDGSRFTAWNTISDVALPAVPVRALRITSRGSLLVGLDDGGIREIRNGTLIEITRKGLRTSEGATELAEDRAGTLWMVANRELYRLRGGQWEKVELPWRFRPGSVLQPLVSRNGDLWVATRWGVFHRAAANDAFELVSHEYVWGIHEDGNGVMWTTDIAAGYRRLGAPAAPRHPLEGAGYRLTHDRRGNLWVATFGEGLWRVREAEQSGPPRVERANLRTGLSSDSVQSVLEDRDGNIWVGTTGGLHRLQERPLTPVENVAFVVAMEPADGARMWAGTTNGIQQFSGAPGPWGRIGPRSPGPDARSMARDKTGTLWVGASDGLWRLAGGQLTHVTLPGDPQMQLMSVVPDISGTGLWLGDGDWLFHWDGTRLEPLPRPSSAADLQRITLARGDSSGRVWLGFAGGRVGYLTSARQVKVLGATDGMEGAHTAIHAIVEGADRTIWIGGSGGLSRFQHGRVATVGAASGLPGVRVWSVVEDLQRRLWLSVDRGLVRVERDELNRGFDDPAHRLSFRFYDTHDGLAGASVGIIGSSRGGDGTLWFVRGGGVTVVSPDVIDDRPSMPPALRIEDVVVDDRPRRLDSLASLPAGTTRVEIRYTALTLSSSDRIRFRYRLEGVDGDWVNAGTRRTAFYTNLAPGDYRFHVDAGGEDGSWQAAPVAWSFSVEPAFYQTRWFSALVAAAGLLAVWGAWRVRLRLVRQQFSLALAERARLSREIHDTLLQSLVGVALQFDAIAENLDSASGTAKEQLLRVRRQVEAYVRDARQSISDLRSPLLEATDLATVLREFGKRAVADTRIRFVSSVLGTPREYSPKIDNELLRIGQEAITNAVRHSAASQIALELRFDDAAVTLRVSDDGHGFDASCPDAEPDKHYGMTTMRERAEELGGRLSVVSTRDRGTVVEAIVPTELTALDEVPMEIG
jgi:signal transduction histidine kinase/ligand-binding sensor domain-containing protein